MEALRLLLDVFREWLANHRPSFYFAMACISILYLLYRPPPEQRDRTEPANCSGAQQPSKVNKPRITLSTMGNVVFDGFSLRIAPGSLEALRRLAAYGDLYLITSEVTSDDAEKAVRGALEREGILAIDGIDKRKLLMCSSKMGRVAMCRQIEPEVHIDSAADLVAQLAPHLPLVALVGAEANHNHLENVHVATTLAEFADVYLATRGK